MYDLARGELVLHGGDDGSAASPQTWALRGATWVDLTPSGLLPIVPASPAAAYDAAHAKIVLFNGAQTWQWDGTSWQREPIGMTGQLNGPALTFDGEHVIYCGGVKFEFGVQTWYSTCRAWSGEAWSLVDVGTNFGPARAGHAMAFDEARGQVVMFGGRESTVNYSDTWLLTDTGWMASTATGPPARLQHAMVYDRLRQRVVMFGGANGTALLGDTWEWDGATWTDRSGSGGAPSPRAAHSMVYDARRRSVILYGGDDGAACCSEATARPAAPATPGSSATTAATRSTRAASTASTATATARSGQRSGLRGPVRALRRRHVRRRARDGAELPGRLRGRAGLRRSVLRPGRDHHAVPGRLLSVRTPGF